MKEKEKIDWLKSHCFSEFASYMNEPVKNSTTK